MSVMQLGHLLTRSVLTYLEVSSEVFHDSFCQLGNSVSLSWVVCREAFCLQVVSSSRFLNWCVKCEQSSDGCRNHEVRQPLFLLSLKWVKCNLLFSRTLNLIVQLYNWLCQQTAATCCESGVTQSL